MKPQLVEIEKEMTVTELLEKEGLTAAKYLVSVNGHLIQGTETLKQGQQAKIFPAIKGGSTPNRGV